MGTLDERSRLDPVLFHYYPECRIVRVTCVSRVWQANCYSTKSRSANATKMRKTVAGSAGGLRRQTWPGIRQEERP